MHSRHHGRRRVVNPYPGCPKNEMVTCLRCHKWLPPAKITGKLCGPCGLREASRGDSRALLAAGYAVWRQEGE